MTDPEKGTMKSTADRHPLQRGPAGPSPERIARTLIEADRVSDAQVQAIACTIPLGALVDVVVALTALVNQRPVGVAGPDARACHAAYGRGERDPVTIEGERTYQRLRARRRRAALRDVAEVA